MKPETLDCRSAKAAIEAFVDGVLAEPERSRLESHAARCTRCAAQIRLAERIRDELRDLPRLDAPEQVIARIKAEARANPPTGNGTERRFWKPGWARPAWAALAAAAVLAVLATSFLMPRRPEPPSDELVRASREARYALARVAQLTRKASLDASAELRRRQPLEPAVESLARSLGRVRPPTPRPAASELTHEKVIDPSADDGGTES